MNRGAIVTLVIGASMLGACGGPQGPTEDELAQMRADSIAAAQAREQARRDSIAAAQRAREQARRDSIEAAQRERARLAAEAERAREIIAERVHFEFDRSELTAEARQVLTRKIAVLRRNSRVRLRIEGHADERGSVEYNLALGKRRAESVKTFLTGFGLDAGRFETVTYGEERPIDPGHEEDAWAQNRRAEFRITAGGESLRAPVSQ